MWTWLITAALAQSLAQLDASPPPAPVALTWESPPRASMVKRGGNGPLRTQYALQADPRTYGAYVADAVSYEYIDGKLGTVIAVFKRAYDADGLRTDLERDFGPATYVDDQGAVRIWRGDRVRVAWRRQADDLWTVTWSWLALHGGDEAGDPSPIDPFAPAVQPIGPPVQKSQ